jgi:hypothetical protein
MSEYAPRFAENKIDVSVLAHLTDHDLKDIGVALGHRRKILAAIAKFAGAVSKPVLASEPKAQDSAERRQVTVMFSDLISRFDRALCPHGPRGLARDHFGLSEVRPFARFPHFCGLSWRPRRKPSTPQKLRVTNLCLVGLPIQGPFRFG